MSEKAERPPMTSAESPRALRVAFDPDRAREPDHDCDHPVDDYLPGGGDVWTCPECGKVWEAHIDIYWAPAED